MQLRTRAAALTAVLALSVVVTVPAAARPKPKTIPATCDQIPGVNQAVNERWRVFNPADTDRDLAIEPTLWACRRAARPATRVLPIPLASSAGNLVGDVLEADGSGRYNANGELIDLANLRSVLRYNDSVSGSLLDTGAVIGSPTRTASFGVPEREDGLDASGLSVFDATGQRDFETAPRWQPDGSGTFPSAEFPSAAVTFAMGFYFAGPGGSLQRFVPTGAASTAVWPKGRDLRWKRYHPRIRRPTAGVTVSYVGFRELHSRAATATRPASLTLHTPFDESLQGSPLKSDLVARLVPGSEAELKLLGPVILGRFADRPGELRLRTVRYGQSGRFVLDVPAPASLDPSSFARGYHAMAFIAGDQFLVFRYDEDTGRYVEHRVPAPAGAHDLAVVGSPTSEPSGWLLYTDAQGQSAAVRYLPTS